MSRNRKNNNSQRFFSPFFVKKSLHRIKGIEERWAEWRLLVDPAPKIKEVINLVL